MKTSGKKRYKGGPLLCWDVFMMQEYPHNKELAADLHQLKKMAEDEAWEHDWNFRQLLLEERKTILVTDPLQRILFASSNLYDMAGYQPEEVLGKSPRQFQGPDTNQAIRAEIRQAVADRKPFSTTLINYRKDGSAYSCSVEGFPVFDRKGVLKNFIAFEELVD